MLATLLAQAFNINNHLGFTSRVCAAWIVYESVVSIVLVTAVEAILLLRIYAFYERSRCILFLVTLLFIGQVVTNITVVVVSIPQGQYSVELGCVILYVPPYFNAIWISALTFQSILFILTIVKYYMRVSRSLGRHSLIRIFMRDGAWAFFDVFVILLLNLVFFELKTKQAPLFYKWLLAIVSCTGSHVLLNLRRLAHGSKSEDDSELPMTGTTLADAAGPVGFPRHELTTHIDVEGISIPPGGEVNGASC